MNDKNKREILRLTRENSKIKDEIVRIATEAINSRDAKIKTLKARVEEIAQEAHTMGRVYAMGGEKLNPAEEFKRVTKMVYAKLKEEQEEISIPGAEIKGYSFAEKACPVAKKQEEYEKYEFCKNVPLPREGYTTKCNHLNSTIGCCADEEGCPYTAKEFHKWLKENNYKIVLDKTIRKT